MKIAIETPDAAAARAFADGITGNDLSRIVEISEVSGNVLQVVINKDHEAALDLLSKIVMAQPWYIGFENPLAEQLKKTARLIGGRRQFIDDKVNEALGIDPATNTSFNEASNWRQVVDPLVFDLDGDGIETVGINGYKTTLFDHNDDGIKTGTGWVKSDDALLVLDRNGNGTIDNGGELFGIDTLLANGQKAGNGFAALADLDSNNDGIISALDTFFDQLRLWRDFNQDGVSQSNELFTLNQIGIAGINVASNGTGNAQNGNQIGATGTFIWEDGHEGTIGGAGQMADIDFSVDTFHSHFTDTTRAFPAYFAQTFIPVQTYASRGC